jgi:hypothetical protein
MVEDKRNTKHRLMLFRLILLYSTLIHNTSTWEESCRLGGVVLVRLASEGGARGGGFDGIVATDRAREGEGGGREGEREAFGRQ